MPYPMSLCCGSPKMRNRHKIGWSILAAFIALWQTPLGWLFCNFLGPLGAMYEYSQLQYGILKNMHASRSTKFLALHE